MGRIKKGIRQQLKNIESKEIELKDIDSYTHENNKRTNIPTASNAKYDIGEEKNKHYQYDEHLDPSLQWAGKKERGSFDIKTVSLHMHEKINPLSIISSVRTRLADPTEQQMSLLDNGNDYVQKRRQAIEFYHHDIDWTNRLIAGDSLLVMNSLLEKEGMGGKIQMAYMDPPYGIKYGSNFQPFVNRRDVKDGKDSDLTQEPEMIKAFRDTWELGIHSYLTYLRDRLFLVRELLHDTGSVFVQISDENIHLVRNILDEVFGAKNFCSMITFRKKGMPFGAKVLEGMSDYIIWYAKNKENVKYNKLFELKSIQEDNEFKFIDDENGGFRRLTREEISNLNTSKGVFKRLDLCSSGYSDSTNFEIEYNGKTYKPTRSVSWKTNEDGIRILKKENRLFSLGELLYYKIYFDDYPVKPLTNLWNNTRGEVNKTYVVQTSTLPIQRCMLMSTDPGELVLDITCGSGTTAYVAEQWGRRWITCDTSRVAIALTKQRLMTSIFDYYKLLYPEQGVSSGFIYKTVPHITLGSIANNEPSMEETLLDKPIIDKNKLRVTGPFTVEAVPSPVVKAIDTIENNDNTLRQLELRDELLATGILGKNGQKIKFSRVEPLSGTKYLQADAETLEKNPCRVVISFSNEDKPLDSRMVMKALDEAEDLRPKPKMIIFAAFQFDPEAARVIEDTKWPNVTLLKVQMNTDLLTQDLKKKRSSNQSFWLVGQPDVEVIRIKSGRHKGKCKVVVNGFDYYDVKKGIVESGDKNRIAMWMLDTNYDGLCINPKQCFFPMSGTKDGWNKLAKTLKTEINQELIYKYSGNESLPFKLNIDDKIAVKIIDDRGIESLKVIKAVEING